jgi:hypothetical protein
MVFSSMTGSFAVRTRVLPSYCPLALASAEVVMPCGYQPVAVLSPLCQQKAATAFGCGLHEEPTRFAVSTTSLVRPSRHSRELSGNHLESLAELLPPIKEGAYFGGR